ncbi:formate dehydrogenase subunit delta [Granulosicoccaceae sp. 1_MG-2023]|nr:formate dehydrogenase subunit delta [Granulosicoccaceae sp. 1_MG-2023]
MQKESHTNLVKMVNQIAGNVFFKDNHDEAIDKVATHMRKFWAPSMRDELFEYEARDGHGLSDIAREAVRKLRRDS